MQSLADIGTIAILQEQALSRAEVLTISRLVNGREDLIIETLLRVKSRLTAALGSSLGR